MKFTVRIYSTRPLHRFDKPMGKFIDITGQRYSMLTVLRRVENKGIQPRWECKCDCGVIKVITAGHLKNGRTKSCGCIVGGQPSDLAGKVFGRLTAIKMVSTKPITWECICSCGNSCAVESKKLLGGDNKSCGCAQIPKKTYIGETFGKFTVNEFIEPKTWKVTCSCGTNLSIGKLRLKAGLGCDECKYAQYDLKGQRFGKLLVLKKSASKTPYATWDCFCACGNIKTVIAGALRSGNVTSCGCLRAAKDLVGQQIGKLLVLKKEPLKSTGNVSRWSCLCACGNTCIVTSSRLLSKSSKVKSCGCTPKLDLTGLVQGSLTVLHKDLSYTKAKGTYWRCQCACGQIITLSVSRITTGNVTHCGCKTVYKQDGLSNTKEYRTWQGIINRCYKINHSHFKYYGGREPNPVQVCDRWLEPELGFKNFLADLGPAPDKSYSIERIDVNGHYEPSNCCWIKKGHQQRNKRNSRLTVEAVREIKRLYALGKSFAEIYHTIKVTWPQATYNTVRCACIGISWVDV